MRNPVTTEADAFTFLVTVLVLFAAVALVGLFLGGWLALVAFLLLGPPLFYWYFRGPSGARSPEDP